MTRLSYIRRRGHYRPAVYQTGCVVSPSYFRPYRCSSDSGQSPVGPSCSQKACPICRRANKRSRNRSQHKSPAFWTVAVFKVSLQEGWSARFDFDLTGGKQVSQDVRVRSVPQKCFVFRVRERSALVHEKPRRSDIQRQARRLQSSRRTGTGLSQRIKLLLIRSSCAHEPCEEEIFTADSLAHWLCAWSAASSAEMLQSLSTIASSSSSNGSKSDDLRVERSVKARSVPRACLVNTTPCTWLSTTAFSLVKQCHVVLHTDRPSVAVNVLYERNPQQRLIAASLTDAPLERCLGETVSTAGYSLLHFLEPLQNTDASPWRMHLRCKATLSSGPM